MGIEKDDAVIATVEYEHIEPIVAFRAAMPKAYQEMLIGPFSQLGVHTFILVPDGSKEG